MKTIIHVNQHVVKANSKNGVTDPVLTCKTYKENIYAHEVIIYGQDGKEAARIIYRPEKALSCGAKVWIETLNKVETINKSEGQEEVGMTFLEMWEEELASII
jgi:hypothetical protein